MRKIILLALLLSGCTPTVTWQTRTERSGITCVLWRAQDKLHAPMAWATCKTPTGEYLDPMVTEESSIFAPFLGAVSAAAP